MGGGLMQLVAYGSQDIYLTGNPQITFFKVVYRRHTNFSMESIKQALDGTADFGRTVVTTISRNGDLVGRMYLEHNASFTRPLSVGAGESIGTVERYGDSLIKECEIEIGGQRIDKHISMWNRVYSDLTQFNPTGHFGASSRSLKTNPASGNGTLYQLMTGNGYGLNTGAYTTNFNNFAFATNTSNDGTINGFDYRRGAQGGDPSRIIVNKIFIPLNFWFNRNTGLALPLIALQYHEVKVKISFEEIKNLIREDVIGGENFTGASHPSSDVSTLHNSNLWCDYIYLDTDERRRFAQVSHEYLIEQLQYSSITIDTPSPSINLKFNHPIKELVWCMRNTTIKSGVGGGGGRHQVLPAAQTGGQPNYQGDPTSGPVSIDQFGGDWQLKINGHERFKKRDTRYFTRTQVWQHHTGYGGTPTIGDDNNNNQIDNATTVGADSIAVYSFALKPEDHQPSGTCNFSRIDKAKLVGSSVTIEHGESGSGTRLKSIGITDQTTDVTMIIFAVNYNVLRIMSGMGGLAYSN